MQLLPSWNFTTFLFYSLMYSYFYYCITSWASTYQTNFRRLFILQKRLLKSLNKSHFKAICEGTWWTRLHLLQQGQFMFSIAKIHSCPLQGLKTIHLKQQFHSYNTRNSSPTVYPIVKQTVRTSQTVFSRIQDSFKFTWQRSHQLSIMIINKNNNAN